MEVTCHFGPEYHSLVHAVLVLFMFSLIADRSRVSLADCHSSMCLLYDPAEHSDHLAVAYKAVALYFVLVFKVFASLLRRPRLVTVVTFDTFNNILYFFVLNYTNIRIHTPHEIIFR